MVLRLNTPFARPKSEIHSPSRVIMAAKEQAWEIKVARKTRKRASNSK